MAEYGSRLDIICMESQAFYALVEEVVGHMKDQQSFQHDKWISDEEAMKMLRISSRTTLQKLRNEGAIRVSQPTKKLL
jgi:predicted NUDIX family NTP pyrophosphohydrolase